jgi:molecular chaperone GrpE
MDKEKQKIGEPKGGLFEMTVKAVIVRDEKDVLLLKRSKDSVIFPGKYDLPGGSVENGETLQEAMLREIEEETGIQVEIGPILYAFDFMKDGKEKDDIGHGKGVRFIAFYKSGEVKLNEENETFQWMDIDEAIAKLSDKGYERDKKTAVTKAKEYLAETNSMDRLKRCQADFENYKKRQAENQRNFIQYASENIIAEIIPVLDNFHVSTEHIPENQKDGPWVVGIMHIQKQLEKVLTDNGVEEIKVKVGDKFDPRVHESIGDSSQSTVQSSEQEEKNHEPKTKNQELIKKIVLRGYKIGDRIVRPAKVVVT